jgi:hypothetical protein
MFYYINYRYIEVDMGHPLETHYPMGGACGDLRPGVGDEHGWWGIFPTVNMSMGKSYPLPSLCTIPLGLARRQTIRHADRGGRQPRRVAAIDDPQACRLRPSCTHLLLPFRTRLARSNRSAELLRGRASPPPFVPSPEGFPAITTGPHFPWVPGPRCGHAQQRLGEAFTVGSDTGAHSAVTAGNADAARRADRRLSELR